MTINRAAVLLAALTCCSIASAHYSLEYEACSKEGPGYSQSRSAKVLRAFVRDNPCPVTGEASTSCPGYRLEHIVPLCLGGKDEVSNIAWVIYEDWRRYANAENTVCAKIRKLRKARCAVLIIKSKQ